MTVATTTRNGLPVPATDSSDTAYLDFLGGMRRWQMANMRVAVRDRAPELVREWEAETGRTATTAADAHEIFDRADVFRWRHMIERVLQEKLWDGSILTYGRRREDLEADLNAYDRMGPGSVTWSPDFETPAYIKHVNFHLQPGGYYDDRLLGHVYHNGTDLYVGGRNSVHSPYIDFIPVPADGQVRRVVDLGTAVGQSATALKTRFPDAEVWGIDVSAPMVRYAHKRAVEMGVDVHFAQMSVDAMTFEDNSVDLIYAYILFHETPVKVTRGAMREAQRVLRPGGLFVINDVGPLSPLHPGTPLGQWFLDFATHDNEDPFARGFIELDLDQELTAAGFAPPDHANTAEIGLGAKGLVVARK
jgi:SAM-dependent methyltransferase